MNDAAMQRPRCGFESRLEAELVKVVAQRAAAPQQRSAQQRSAQQRSAMSWPPARIGLAAGTAAAAAVAGALGVQAFTHSAAAPASTVPASTVPASIVPASTVPGAKSGPVHIRTAAFTVDSYSDGTIHVTWNKNQYQDSAGLQQALQAAGFPVLIREGVFCMGPHDNGYLDPSGVGPGVGQVMQGEQEADGSVVFVFTPSAMPHGDELFIGYLSPSQLAVTHGRPGSVERLVPTNAPLTCTTQPPPANTGHQS
jgi:hypothetical protein